MASQLPDNIKSVRLDLSDRVWHFTRRDGNPKAALESILQSRKILGGSGKYCPDPCVCFTEMPLTEAIRQSPTLNEYAYARMSDYGIGFTKQWVFQNGGRPVIYGPSTERNRLPAEMQWRHCVLDYGKNIDFTWQREWRVSGKELVFDTSDDPLVVLPRWGEAMELLCSDYCEDHVHDEVYATIDWSFVTQDQLRNVTKPQDVEVHRCERG